MIKYRRGKTTEEKQADLDYEEGRIKTIQGVGPLSIKYQTFKETKEAAPISVKKYLIRSKCFRVIPLLTTDNHSLRASVSGARRSFGCQSRLAGERVVALTD